MPRLLDSLSHASVLVAVLLVVPERTQAEFRFAAPYTSYGDLWENPSSLVTADLNADGHADVAVASQNQSTVWVFLGQGDGSLSQHVAFAVAEHPYTVRAGDLDQNGTQDLVVACYIASKVTILWGAGDGTFPNRTDLTATGGPVALAVGDLEDSDPYPDFVVGTNNGTIWVFRNTGGSISAPSSLFTIGTTVWTVLIDDMDIDGRNDIIVSGYYESTVSVFLGTGNANFNPRIITNAGHPRGMLTANVNGDGYPDVLAVCDTTFVTLLGQGDGTFSPTPAMDYLSVTGLTAGDFDNDGEIDVATSADGQNGALVAFKGNGDGTFAGRKDSPGPGGYEMASADLDEDGRLDLLGIARGLGVARGYGDGSFGLNRSYDMGYFPAQVRAGDLNNDGRPDLVVPERSGSGGFTLRLGELGGFGPKATYPGFGEHDTAAFGDINGDGAQDVVLGARSDSMAVYLGNGGGTFGMPTGYSVVPASVAVGDINQDGYDDVVSGDQNVVSVWLGHADGTLERTEDYPAEAPVLLDDFNEDGKLDLVASRFAFLVTLFFPGNGDGTFGDPIESGHNTLPNYMSAGDLDGDQHLDLLIAFYGGDMSTLLGDGLGNFQEVSRPYVYLGLINQMDLGDFDLDGNLDACFADLLQGVLIFRGNGDGTLSQALSIGTARSVVGVGIGDFGHQDGTPDIAVTGESLYQGFGAVTILYNLLNAQVGVESPIETPGPPLRLLANPARSRLSVQINLSTAEHVRLEVLDLSGRRVAVPVDRMLPAGDHVLSWRGESAGGRLATSGVYVIRMTADGKTRATKAVWLRN